MSESANILLVEDDRHIGLALQIRLRATGHIVRLAASVAEALAAIEELVPDVAVIDVNLPDGNGIALMRSFSSLKSTAPITSIIMSASRRPGLREEALGEGACVFLEKPFPSANLISAVSQHAHTGVASGS